LPAAHASCGVHRTGLLHTSHVFAVLIRLNIAAAYEEAATQAWKDYHNNTNMDQPAVKWCAQLYESVKNGETLACIQEVRTPRTLDQLRILQAAR
jgi:hypothetical protein